MSASRVPVVVWESQAAIAPAVRIVYIPGQRRRDGVSLSDDEGYERYVVEVCIDHDATHHPVWSDARAVRKPIKNQVLSVLGEALGEWARKAGGGS